MQNLEKVAESVKLKEDFIKFLELLIQDLKK